MSDITINAKRVKLRAQPYTASGSIPCSISFLRRVFRSLPRICTAHLIAAGLAQHRPQQRLLDEADHEVWRLALACSRSPRTHSISLRSMISSSVASMATDCMRG